ncbi:HigA family addiction module antitoxin [Polyangium jinanense]|uniref:HigA family addiction module antidote protein n=1 Tax=Polyangium jinanense TaxID=2829994 RepID=A0A9X3X0L9_9BACT|nr:HigA family addiction module antitoxin [Polyangium jinanense]MDC3952751.1 HigA family addiction module antidote protein [Polyangium jinanense]MDC3980370.1 HigA family addiction module antidote protein [Polyangium jinanense]
MDNTRGPKFEPNIVPHPGGMVVEYLEFNAWSQRELARRTGLTPKTISEICAGKAPITPATAIALEKVFHRPAHLWLNLQRQFDEAEARRRVRDAASGWKDWADKFPMKLMKRYGWLDVREGQDDVDALLSFFAVSSPQSWTSVWQAADVSYRQTRKFQLSEEATAAWVRAAELTAAELETSPFDEARLRSVISKLRQCTRMRAEQIMAPVQELCGAAGVAVVWVHDLPNTGISGCARWLSSNRALIALTLRYKTDDQLWFTFFHELGHILLHRRDRPFVLDNAIEDLGDHVVDPEMQRFEDEANRFAADTLIPPESLSRFVRAGRFTNESIHDFAEEVGVGPGIVVGRLQHDKILSPHQGNRLKQRLAWGVSDEDSNDVGGGK